MSCDKCIFAKEIQPHIAKCCNPDSERCEEILCIDCGKCKDGKSSMVEINEMQRQWLTYMMYV